MAKYKIGITEKGDAGIDLSWISKLKMVDAAIVITKKITEPFLEAVLENQQKIIVHATCTGYAQSILEPNVPIFWGESASVNYLVEKGFPKEQIVIRVDPIIPTNKGLKKAKHVIETFMKLGFTRYRVSVLDMYPHVRERFRQVGLPLPYGENRFASKEQMAAVDAMLQTMIVYWQSLGNDLSLLRIESCAEPCLTVPLACGCISAYDLQLLGLDPNEADSYGKQRKQCMCYSGKTELLSCNHPCKNGCLYCYWKTEQEN